LQTGDCMKANNILLVILSVALLLSSLLVVFEPALAATASENTWAIKAPAPDGTNDCKAAVVNGKIYLIGGYYNFMYDPETNSWTGKTHMQTARTLFGIAVWQDKIYVIGGAKWDWSKGYIAYNTTEVYDPSNDTWQTKQAMPTARNQLQANVVDGQIYLISGRGGGPMSLKYLNEVYNIDNDSWTTKAPIPFSVASYQSAVCGGKIYVMGGQDENLRSGNIDLDITQIYDPSNDSWSIGSSMLVHLWYAAAAATTGANAPRQIYLIGGADMGGNRLMNTTQVYNPEDNSWTYGASMPTARDSVTIGVVDDKLYAIGRSWGHSDNEVYTPFGYGTPDPAYVYEHTPPNVALESSLNAPFTNSTVPLVFFVDKACSWAGYSLDGQPTVTIDGNTSIANVTNGIHSLTLYVNDTFGNYATPQTISFTVAVPADLFPILIFVAVTTVLAVVAVVVVRAFYRSHRGVFKRQTV
jgi:N-acetylneuraminic acid mutarotase